MVKEKRERGEREEEEEEEETFPPPFIVVFFFFWRICSGRKGTGVGQPGKNKGAGQESSVSRLKSEPV